MKYMAWNMLLQLLSPGELAGQEFFLTPDRILRRNSAMMGIGLG